MTQKQIALQAMVLAARRGGDPLNSQPRVARGMSLIRWLLDQKEMDLNEKDAREATQPLPMLLRPQAD